MDYAKADCLIPKQGSAKRKKALSNPKGIFVFRSKPSHLNKMKRSVLNPEVGSQRFKNMNDFNFQNILLISVC